MNTFPSDCDTPLSSFLDDLLGFFETEDGDITIDAELVQAFVAGLADAKACAEVLERFALAHLPVVERGTRARQILAQRVEVAGNVIMFPVRPIPAPAIIQEGGAA